MVRRRSVTVQNCVEGLVFHLHLNSLAVFISCLLVPLLLKKRIASLRKIPNRTISDKFKADYALLNVQ